MRSRLVVRLFAAVLAIISALSSPVTALAHGHAHEHETHHHAQTAPSSPEAAEHATVTAPEPPSGEHVLLHAQCIAIVHLAAAVLPPQPASLPDDAPPRGALVGVQPVVGSPMQGRASPPDQPRAPPRG